MNLFAFGITLCKSFFGWLIVFDYIVSLLFMRGLIIRSLGCEVLVSKVDYRETDGSSNVFLSDHVSAYLPGAAWKYNTPPSLSTWYCTLAFSPDLSTFQNPGFISVTSTLRDPSPSRLSSSLSPKSYWETRWWIIYNPLIYKSYIASIISWRDYLQLSK